MSADNRILIANDGLYWCVWHGSCSVNYSEPPEDAQKFDTKIEAEDRAANMLMGMVICEGGIQYLTPEEVLEGLLEKQNQIEEDIEYIKKQIPNSSNLDPSTLK